MAGSQTISFIVQFAASVVVARLLTPYELGIYAVAIATVGAVALIQALGLGGLVVREPDLTPETITTVFTINALVSVLISVSVVGLAFGGEKIFHDRNVRDVLMVLALAPLASIFDFLPAARLEREGDFRVISFANGIRSGVNAAATVGFVVLGFKFRGLAIAQVVGVYCATAYIVLVGRRFFSFKFGFSRWRPVIGSGVQLLAVAGMASVFRRGSDILLGRLLGLSALGLFNRASSISGLIHDKIRLTFERVLFAQFSKDSRQGEALGPAYLHVVELMSAVLWPAFAGLAVLSAPLIQTVYGAHWRAAAAPLSLLAVSGLIDVSITLTWEIFLINRELKLQSKIECFRTIVGFAAFAAGCMISVEAAAAARIFDSIFANLLYRKHVERMTQTYLRDYLAIYARSGFLTLLAIAPASIALALFYPGDGMPSLALGAGIALGGILWLVGLAILRHPLLREFMLILRARGRDYGRA